MTRCAAPVCRAANLLRYVVLAVCAKRCAAAGRGVDCSRGRRPSECDSGRKATPWSTSSTTPARGGRSVDSDSAWDPVSDLEIHALRSQRVVAGYARDRRGPRSAHGSGPTRLKASSGCRVRKVPGPVATALPRRASGGITNRGIAGGGSGGKPAPPCRGSAAPSRQPGAARRSPRKPIPRELAGGDGREPRRPRGTL